MVLLRNADLAGKVNCLMSEDLSDLIYEFLSAKTWITLPAAKTSQVFFLRLK